MNQLDALKVLLNHPIKFFFQTEINPQQMIGTRAYFWEFNS